MNFLKKLQVIILVILSIAVSSTKAQDLIVTMKGTTIKAHVLNAGTNTIRYRKHWYMVRPKKITTDKVLYIKYDNGTKTVFHSVNTAKNYKNYGDLQKSNQTSKTDSLTKTANATQTGAHKYYIEQLGSHYRLDSSEIVGLPKINEIMASSTNPMVLASLKTAKMFRMLNTITKIAAVPSSSGGAYSSFLTFQNLFKQLKTGPAPFSTYLKAGLSVTLTMSLPITQMILQHIQKKFYDKTLTMYSEN